MADIIRLRGSPHDQTRSLMPWYVNGALEAEEATAVERHLDECAECREELEAERVLALRVASTPLDVEHGWALLDECMIEGRAGAVPRGRFGRLLRQRATLVWAATAQLAAAALVLVAVTNLREAPTSPAYHALGAAPGSVAANGVILFAPTTQLSEMRKVLDGAQARLVDGPTATGAYLVRIEVPTRDQALARLRQSPQVVLAEPIDAAGRP